MRSLFIRWSFTERFCIMRLSTFVAITSLWVFPLYGVKAVDDTPDIAIEDDPFAKEFALALEQRMLPQEAAYDNQDSGYLALMPSDIKLPDPVVIAPGKPDAQEMLVIAAAPAEKLIDSPPEWVLYQGNELSQEPEERLFARINSEFDAGEGRCIPGYDCPTAAPMTLPEWPEQDSPRGTPFEIFDTQLISPFAPIPELDDLPFPEA